MTKRSQVLFGKKEKNSGPPGSAAGRKGSVGKQGGEAEPAVIVQHEAVSGRIPVPVIEVEELQAAMGEVAAGIGEALMGSWEV